MTTVTDGTLTSDLNNNGFTTISTDTATIDVFQKISIIDDYKYAEARRKLYTYML